MSSNSRITKIIFIDAIPTALALAGLYYKDWSIMLGAYLVLRCGLGFYEYRTRQGEDAKKAE